MWTCSKSATGLAHSKPWPSLEGSLSDASAFWSAAVPRRGSGNRPGFGQSLERGIARPHWNGTR